MNAKLNTEFRSTGHGHWVVKVIKIEDGQVTYKDVQNPFKEDSTAENTISKEAFNDQFLSYNSKMFEGCAHWHGGVMRTQEEKDILFKEFMEIKSQNALSPEELQAEMEQARREDAASESRF